MTVRLDHDPWPAVERAGDGAALLLVPVGSTEQHGPHLPFDTDTRVATAVAGGAGAVLGLDGPVVVAPAVAYGSSGEHQDFPGTLSVGTEVLTAVLVELGRSATTWARRVLLVNGHGGNLEAVTAAVRRLRGEGRDAVWVPALPAGRRAAAPGTPPPDAHAGRVETSLLLALDPSVVDLAAAVAGPDEPLDRLLPALRTGGVRAVSPGGVLGDPAGADAQQGRELLAAAVTEVVRRARAWTPDDTGRLVAPRPVTGPAAGGGAGPTGGPAGVLPAGTGA